jgi:type II secretory pathway component GspD/PulD (secretin)
VKKHVIKFFSVFLMCLPLLAHSDSMTLEVIQLKHRMTDDVIEILRPMVVPGGTVTGMNNQLIIKTTPANLAEIKTILDSLDRSPRRLMISVKQDVSGQIQSREQSVSGRYSTGDVTVGAGDTRRSRDGLIISGRDEDGNEIRYRAQDSTSYTDDRGTYTVQATEGYPAYINVGQSVPVQSRTGVITPGGGIVISEGTEYVDAGSGFYVMPRLSGNQVTLLIAPKLTRVSPGKAPVFDVQNVETTASGQLGEWIELGGLNQQFSDSNRRILSSSSARGSEVRSIYVKVVEIK